MARLFFSYSHHDEQIRNELEVHLSMLKRQGIIETWHDRRIDAGSELNHVIDSKLEDSDIILLLISPHFLASDYCYEKEMSKALEMHQAGQAKVIPVILEHCEWQEAPFGKLLGVPKDGRPVSEFPNINKAFHEIAGAIRAVVEKINNSRITEPLQAQTSQAEDTPAIKKETVRSSNLRIKREFSDYDKNRFMSDAFEYMAKYFENSLNELKARNSSIGHEFRRIDANSFTASVYYNGEEKSHCRIRYGGQHSVFGGITYSAGRMSDNSINDFLTVSDDGHMLYLSAQMNFMGTSGKDHKLTYEGASEYYWSLFIEPLQR